MHVCVDHVCSIVLLSACSRRYCTPSAPYTSCINAMPPTPTIAIRVVRPSAFDRPILVTCMATALIQHRVPPTRKDSNKHLAILDSRGTVRNYSVARWVVQTTQHAEFTDTQRDRCGHLSLQQTEQEWPQGTSVRRESHGRQQAYFDADRGAGGHEHRIAVDCANITSLDPCIVCHCCLFHTCLCDLASFAMTYIDGHRKPLG